VYKFHIKWAQDLARGTSVNDMVKNSDRGIMCKHLQIKRNIWGLCKLLEPFFSIMYYIFTKSQIYSSTSLMQNG